MTAILTQVLAVFRSVGTWIGEAVQDMIPIFWDASANSGAGALTFMGVLGVAGLSFSVAFLLIGIVQRFLKFSA